MNEQRTADSQSVYSAGNGRDLIKVKTKAAILRQKRWFYLLVAVIILLLILLIIVIILAACMKKSIKPKIMLCDSEECMKIAASLKESMNYSVDPCDNFYNYVCGRWNQEHPIPDSKITHSWFDEGAFRIMRIIRNQLEKNITNITNLPRSVLQAQIFYKSCMDMDALKDLGLEPLYNVFEELSIPVIPSAFTNATTDFIQQLARVKRVLGTEVFIGVDVLPDPKNNTRNILVIGAPIWRISFPGKKKKENRLREYLKRKYKSENDDDEEGEDPEKIYLYDSIKEVISNGTAEYRNCKSSINEPIEYEDRINDVVEQIYNVSSYLYLQEEIRFNESDFDEVINEENYMFVNELQQITDQHVELQNLSLETREIWKPFINEIFRDIIDPDWIENNKILIWDLDYLKEIAVFMAKTDATILETYIWWTVIDILGGTSSEDMRKIRTQYDESIYGLESQDSRSIICVEATNVLMGMAVSWLFVDSSFHESKSGRVIEMLNNIRTAFSNIVVKTDWMDQLTKIATLRKNSDMKYIIGYPEWLFEEGVLDSYYENINLSEKEFMKNVVQMISDEILDELNNLLEENDPDNAYWVTEPTDVNAFHTFFSNQITIPAGILQFPFYNLGLEALNYGAIGSILGHELTHGFDNVGRQYDSDGNYRQWWTNETISEYIERTQCFIDHYNSYYVEEVDEHVNGALTLGENIADNGGLKEAVFAYKIWKEKHGQELLLPGFTDFTHEQLLFLGFAHTWCEDNTEMALRWMLTDSHCPGNIRLHGVLKNSKEFSEAWQCPVGSNMNPEKKCHLW